MHQHFLACAKAEHHKQNDGWTRMDISWQLEYQKEGKVVSQIALKDPPTVIFFYLFLYHLPNSTSLGTQSWKHSISEKLKIPNNRGWDVDNRMTSSQHIQGCGFNSSTTTRKWIKKSKNGLDVSYLYSDIPDQCHTKTQSHLWLYLEQQEEKKKLLKTKCGKIKVEQKGKTEKKKVHQSTALTGNVIIFVMTD